jgi:hypothetical protein
MPMKAFRAWSVIFACQEKVMVIGAFTRTPAARHRAIKLKPIPIRYRLVSRDVGRQGFHCLCK